MRGETFCRGDTLGAYQRSDALELASLVHDLPVRVRVESPVAPSPAESVVAIATATESVQPIAALALFGNVERRGNFRVPDRARAIFGSLVLDLRDVTFPQRVTELALNATFGSIEVRSRPPSSVQRRIDAIRKRHPRNP